MEFTKYRLHEDIKAALRAGDRITDDDFDQILPENYERIADVQWSSVRVARTIARMLCETPDAHLIDLGCGVGKLCLLLALQTNLKLSGIERRATLIHTARRLADENVGDGRITYIQGDILDLDWDPYDVLYLYNPFMEHKCSRSSENLIDANISLSQDAYANDVERCLEKLCDLKEGQRVITYHGFGGTMPETLQMIDSERVGNGTVRLWST
jgi:predicted RNA methylase